MMPDFAAARLIAQPSLQANLERATARGVTACVPKSPCLGALVDRFAQHCHVFDIDADSWREKERKEGLDKKRALKKSR